MSIDTAALGKQFAADMLGSLGRDGGKVGALASAEAAKLALSFAQISDLLAGGQIDAGEAQALVRIQKDAS